MKLTVEFPSVSYREGPEGVRRFACAVEQIGYDHIDVFDHVVMGYPMEGRPPGPYQATMPILEALMLLGHIAAITSRVGLGTEVLVLPQRHPTLVAKQISALDTLSGGRVRLPVGIGGMSKRAWRRVGELGDGWLASRVTDATSAQVAIDAIRRAAEAAGRDPGGIGWQSMVAPPPRDAEGKRFYAEHDRVVVRVVELQKMGFEWVALNATAIFQAGARSVDAMIDALGALHGKIRGAVG